MLRNEAFDALNKTRLKIIRVLAERELSMSEVRELGVNGSRQNAYFHLNLLVKTGLVSKKTVLRKNWSCKAKRQHSTIFRYSLTPLGKEAVEYFSIRGI